MEYTFVEAFIKWLKGESPAGVPTKRGNPLVPNKPAVEFDLSGIKIIDGSPLIAEMRVDPSDKDSEVVIQVNANVGVPDGESAGGSTFEDYTVEITIIGKNNHNLIKRVTENLKQLLNEWCGDIPPVNDDPNSHIPWQVVKSTLTFQRYVKTDDEEYEKSLSIFNFNNKIRTLPIT